MGLFTLPPPTSAKPISPSRTAPEFPSEAGNDWGYAPSIKTQHGYLDVRNPSKDPFPTPQSKLARFHRCWYGYSPAAREITSSAAAQSWDRDVDRRSKEGFGSTVRRV